MEIVKCFSRDCPSKDTCLRHLAEDNGKYQNYANFVCNKENNWVHKIRVNKK